MGCVARAVEFALLALSSHCLPLLVVVSIDRIDADSAPRNTAMLDELLQGYAKTAGRFVDLESCAAAHRVAALRLHDFKV